MRSHILLTLGSLIAICLITGCSGEFQAGSTGAVSSQPGISPSDNELMNDAQNGPAALWETSVPDSNAWTHAAADAFTKNGAALLKTNPSDMTDYCASYSSLTQTSDRMQVWIRILSAMALDESGFRPDAHHLELSRDTSFGLLQLSVKSGDDYDCGFESDSDVRDPAKNISCAVRILSHWVPRDKVVAEGTTGNWLGGARYWGVLRTSRTRSKIQRLTQAFSLCQSPMSDAP